LDVTVDWLPPILLFLNVSTHYSMALLRSAFVHLLTQSFFWRIIDPEFDCIPAVLSTGVYLKKIQKTIVPSNSPNSIVSQYH
jgi:hypothetical protein